jgi:hypothetical protein
MEFESSAPVLIKTGGRIYRIPRTLHESTAQAFERGWFIVEQTQNMTFEHVTPEKENQILNNSFEWIHTKQGLKYS